MRFFFCWSRCMGEEERGRRPFLSSENCVLFFTGRVAKKHGVGVVSGTIPDKKIT